MDSIERMKGEVLEMSTKTELMSREIETLSKQLDDVHWAEEKQNLLQALEQEKDKVRKMT